MKHWAALLLAGLVADQVRADDWPVWRGPEQNGISAETGWSMRAASVKWTVELGDGYSSVSVKNGKVYSAGHVDGLDIVYCLNAGSGKEAWRYSYPCSTGSFKGPRATPIVEDERLYMVSRDGEVFCLNADSGKLVWKTEALKESGSNNSKWGIASSAVIAGDLLLVNIGDHGTALDKNSGKVAWASKGDQSYASPVIMERKGKSVGLFFTAAGLELADVRTGKKVDSYEWKTSWDVNGADPMVIGERIFITSGYGHGCAMLDFASGSLKKVWENKLIQSQFSSCIYLDGYIYGIDGQTKNKGSLRCISAEDGSEKWSTKIGFGSLIAADGKLIVLDERGSLYVVQAAPEKYDELARFETGLKQLCWTSPVLADGTVYCRNDKGTLVAVDVSK
ncbi:MAG: PQQ-binding-like beta-propeller repeat protein [Pontiellaceae bacterium]|nr:PQQ-binding-like beta-propeller repeat protein [Pontiellaceae bacterium]MBN2786084.1 PQQ-binding-like beta-propeller repeat protein [Pontiellaceae bacterium]